MNFSVFLGKKNLFSRNRKIAPHLMGTVFGIALSLVPLIVVLEVADGMIEGITRRYLEIGTYHLQITLAADTSVEGYLSQAARLKKQAPLHQGTLHQGTLMQVIVEIQGLGLVSSQKNRTAVTVRAVPPSLYEEDVQFRRFFKLESGAFDLADKKAALLGKEVAARLGVTVGESVKLMTVLSVGSSEARIIPKVTSFIVKGIFSTGYQELDKLWIYIPFDTGRRILSRQNSRRFIGVKVEDPFRQMAELISLIGPELPSGSNMRTWYQLEKANYKSFQTTRALLTFIMALIVVVAAVNISSSMVMVVLEKNQDIGILKSMGANPGQIRRAFLFTGFIVGLAGTVLGLVLGLLVAININGLMAAVEVFVNLFYRAMEIVLRPLADLSREDPIQVFNTAYYLEKIPIRISLKELYVVGTLTVFLSTLAAYFPARAAGNTKPLDILRKH